MNWRVEAKNNVSGYTGLVFRKDGHEPVVAAWPLDCSADEIAGRLERLASALRNA